MSKIKIKNFGPIKDGFGDEWIDIKKVTVFIGNQGSGKSTVAKLISTFTWLEKALIRDDIKNWDLEEDDDYFIKSIAFHRLQNYLEDNTEIEYIGATYKLKFSLNSEASEQIFEVEKLNGEPVRLPKIMYVPAERNFLSSIENINKVSNLIVGSLQTYSIEFRNAQLAHKGISVDLPINNTKIIYNNKDDENYLVFDEKRLKLSEASSGFHSIVPLYWVTKYLNNFINQDENKLLQSLSPDQTIRRNEELKKFNISEISEDDIRAGERLVNRKYIPKYLVNIVEEPEQNLFPTSQRLLLNSLLAFNTGNNKLVMTTHSPYLINYLTLAVKADMVKDTIKEDEDALQKLNEIVPLKSIVKASDLAIYELNEEDGSVKKLSDYKGLPSDENHLNKGLQDSNELFAQLQEIEKGWR